MMTGNSIGNSGSGNGSGEVGVERVLVEIKGHVIMEQSRVRKMA